MRIVIAFDGSPAAGSAVRAAGALLPGVLAVVACARRDTPGAEPAALARIALPDDVIRDGIAALERAAEEEARATAEEGARQAAEAGLTAEPAVITGTAWAAIRSLARARDADLIVCGTRGQGAFSRATLGSTSSGLVHHLDRPLLVVPEGGGTLAGPLVIGYDGSAGAATVIARAAELFPGREALVVHVWESPLRHTISGRALGSLPVEEIRQMTRDLEAYYRRASAELAEQGAALAVDHGLAATAAEQEARGSAWHGLTTAARAAGAAVVVVGSRGRGAAAATVLGSVSSGLAHNAEAPVLIVP
jgi:nucleotide-binding universal stress UspA family protein